MNQATPIWRLPPYRVQMVQTALAETLDWGLRFAGVDEEWSLSKGAGVRVAVLDTGCDAEHPDLREAVLLCEDFSNSCSGSNDVQGHGTHCAGVIAARQNNVGVIGVAPECRLLVGKVLSDDGSGSSAAVAAGVDWAVAQGADVVSMSLGSPDPSADIRQALQRAVAAGRFVVCAAGNDGRPDSVGYPAAWDELAVAVGAIGPDGKLANFSSRGRQVDVCAPGVNVLSSWPGSRYAKLSGTSMATPFVAGVVALALSRHRQMVGEALRTQADLIEQLHRTAIDAGAPGADNEYGFGLVNPKRLLAEAAGKRSLAGRPLVLGPLNLLGYSWTLSGDPQCQT